MGSFGQHGRCDDASNTRQREQHWDVTMFLRHREVIGRGCHLIQELLGPASDLLALQVKQA